jgi:hypothetical protein
VSDGQGRQGAFRLRHYGLHLIGLELDVSEQRILEVKRLELVALAQVLGDAIRGCH